MLTTKEKQVDRADDPDLAEKMKAEAEDVYKRQFLWFDACFRSWVFTLARKTEREKGLVM